MSVHWEEEEGGSSLPFFCGDVIQHNLQVLVPVCRHKKESVL